jgi:protein subunit release factor A
LPPDLAAESAFRRNELRLSLPRVQNDAETITCTVAAIPDPDEHEVITLNPADLRIKLMLCKLLFIMEGDLREMVQALLHAREEEQLKKLELSAS